MIRESDDNVAVCPECDSSNVSLASPGGHPDQTGTSGFRYYCGRCSAKFDEFDEREARMHSNGGSPDRSKLLKADPEEWP